MSKKRTKKPLQEMTAPALAETTAELDAELAADTFGPLTPAMRARWEEAQRKPGRPRQGRGVQVISVSVEKDLLARSDALAKKLGISRARLIARGLKAVLAAAGET
jgi:hypothetical protein